MTRAVACSIVVGCLLAYLSAAKVQGQNQQTRPAEYSNMYVDTETGDILGWDLQIVTQEDGYKKVTLFCGEGVPVGPVHAEIAPGQPAVLSPEDKRCGTRITLRFVKRGLYLTADRTRGEFLPLHRNFVKQEFYK